MLMIRSELHKLLSNRLGVIALFAPLVGISLLAWLLTRSLTDGDATQNAVLRALQMSQIFPVILGASVTGQEYSESALRSSLLAVPQRARLFWGKTVLVIVAGGVSYSAGLGIATLVLKPDLPLGIMGEAGASWIGLSLLAAFLAAACRSIVVPLVTMVPLILGLSMIIYAIMPLARFLPDLATITVFIGDDPLLLPPGVGGAVLATWVIIAGILAYTVLSRGDVR